MIIESDESEEASRRRKRRQRRPFFNHGIVSVERIQHFVIVVATAGDVNQTLKGDKR